MKKLAPLLILVMLFWVSAVQAQAPNQVNYQAVVRDASGNPLVAGTHVSVRFQIHDLTSSGTVVYLETTSAVTNQFGLITLAIGAQGDLSTVNWGGGAKYLQVSIDPAGGSNFTDMGSSQLLSVPYALFSGNSIGSIGPTGVTGAGGATGPQGPQGAAGAQGVQGPAGAQGPQGPQGIQGAQGPQGSRGATGSVGATGAQGLQGATGATGANGTTGAQGIQGITGANGINGLNGATGATGNNGLNGATGATGNNGLNGATGATGVAGSNGAIGATGANGATGAAGNNGAVGATGATGNAGAVGATGANGNDGATGATGATGNDGAVGPTGANGNDGTMGVTGATGNDGAVGATGVTGNDGAVGATGANGNDGAVGATGATGNDGAVGATGATGSDGAVGPTGANGNDGAVGATGATGNDGAMGATGANGNDGAVGATGATGNDGAAGATGATGNDGAVGATGATGNDGVAGPTGANGNDGAAGATGATGNNGAVGATGATGNDGVAGPTGANGNDGATGVMGATGNDGATGPTGANAPQITNIQDNGDGTTTVYFSDGTTLTLNAPFIGPQGPQGPTGSTGAVGPHIINIQDNGDGTSTVFFSDATSLVVNAPYTGPQGATGATGNDGAVGPTGVQGNIGLAGPTGIQGPIGPTGLLQDGSATGNTTYWDGSQWVTNSNFIYNDGTNIAMGSSAFANNGSIAIGNGSTAQGLGSFAAGPNSTATGNGSAAFGGGTAQGPISLAMGRAAVAGGSSSMAIGNNTTASGTSSVAIGSFNSSTGTSSSAIGIQSTAGGDNSTAMGFGSRTVGSNSLSVGYNTTAQGNNSNAVGFHNTANGNNSSALGTFTTASSYAETDLGSSNTTYTPSSTTSWVGTDRLLDVGNGNYPAQSDALVVLKNGNTGIGTATPTHTLDVNGTMNVTGTATGITPAPGDSSTRFATTAFVRSSMDTFGIQQGTAVGNTMYWDGSKWVTNSNNIYNDGTNVSIGSSTSATNTSVAIGTGSVSSGSASVAMGSGATSPGRNSVSIGQGTNSSGANSTAIGTYTQSSGPYSISMGNGSTASGSNSFTTGVLTTASGNTSTAMGNSTTASGDYSTAMGNQASTNGHTGAFVVGDHSTAVTATADNQFAAHFTGGYMWYNDNSLTPLNTLVYNNGKLGIGTVSPTAQLDASGTVRFENYINGYLTVDANGNLGVGQVTAWNLTGNTGTVAATNFIGTIDSVDLSIRTHNTERIHVTSDYGVVGLGTSTPNAANDPDGYNRLEIYDADGLHSDITQVIGGGSAGWHTFATLQGTLASPAISHNGDTIGQIRGTYYNGTGFSQASGIAFVVDSVPSATSTPGNIVFQTTPVGATAPLTRMTIKSNGKIGIGVAAPSAQLHTSGTVRFQNYTNGLLSVDANGNLGVTTGSGLFTAGTGLSWSGTTLNSTWTTSGNNAFNNNTGNIGINTASPLQTLSVNGNAGIYNSKAVQFFTDGGSTLHGYVGEFSAGSDMVLAAVTNGNWLRIGSNNAPIAFYTDGTVQSGTPKVLIHTNGNVGIGTISPISALDVTGDINASTGYMLSGGAASGNYLRGNGTRFVSSGIQVADIPAGSTNYIQNGSSQQASSNFNISGNGTIGGTGTITGNGAVNGGTLSLGNGTANSIVYANAGLAYPTFTTSSAGTKLKLWSLASPTSADYAIGVGNNEMWFSLDRQLNSIHFSFYGGNTEVANISGTGVINTSTGFTVAGAATSGTYLRGNGSQYVASTIQASDLPSLATNYIVNGTSQQAGSNFNISGDGTIGGNANVTGNALVTGSVGVGTNNPQSSLQVLNGQTYLDRLGYNADASYNFNQGDLVIGDTHTDRGGFGSTNGPSIMLQSSGKNTIAALDRNDNNIGQLAYYNGTWILGDNAGYGNAVIQIPQLAGGGNQLIKTDNSGNLSATGLDPTTGSLVQNGTAIGNTPYWNGSQWVNSANIYNDNGNVGIGTNSPGAKLEVNGTAQVTALGVGTNNPQAAIQVVGGQTFIDRQGYGADPSYNFNNADLVIGDTHTQRYGYDSASTGANIMLQSSGRSSIDALDRNNNNIGQISYYNGTWVIGDNAGYGNGIVQIPGLGGGGTQIVTTDNNGNLGVTSGTGSFIVNGTSQQASSNFNISGNGTVGGTLTTANLKVTAGASNGYLLTSDASGNASWASPSVVSTNIYNSDGTLSGTRTVNMSGYALNLNGGFVETNEDMFVNGVQVGTGNGSGSGPVTQSTILGLGANSSGDNNTAIGFLANNGSSGNNNTSVGANALRNSNNGSNNTAVGAGAGGNHGGNNNTFLGSNAITTGSFSNATAIGANASVGASNSMVLGSINGVNGATGSVNVGIGTTTPSAQLHTTGTVRFQNYNNGYLAVDASGNLSVSAGTAGATGATGETGAVGATGFTGVAGATGTTGATGLTGATGTNGVTGATGSTGAAGATGNAGAAGATGATGLLSSGSAAGNTPYWNGSSWVVNSSNIYNNGGNIGIGTTSPGSQLHTTGTVRFANYTSGMIGVDASGNLQTRTETGTSNQIDVTNGNGVSGNPTYAIDPAYTAALKAQFALSGGGTVSYISGNFSFSSRFIIMDNGNGSQFSTNGYYDINMPANGTVITGVGGAGNVTVAGGSVALSGWQALYYIVPVGSNNTSVPANFRVANYSAAFVVPENWVMIAQVNGDDNTVKLGSGAILQNGQTWASSTGNARVTLNGAANQVDISTGAGTNTVALDAAYSHAVKAGFALTGGGNITYGTNVLSWSQRFIIIAAGNGSQFSTAGYFDINQPTTGTVITGVGGAANQTVGASGVPIPGWCGLYYILPIGSGNASLAANFRIVNYGQGLVIPENWVLIAMQNNDDQTLRLGNGAILQPGQTWSSGAGMAQSSGSANYIQNGTSQQSSSNFNISGNGTIVGTATIGTSAVTGNETVSGGSLNLNNGTTNTIKYTAAGSGPPTFTTSSVGTKLVLSPDESATTVDYGIGVAGATLWSAVPQANSSYQISFYGGTTELMRVRGDGHVGINNTSPNASLDINGSQMINDGLTNASARPAISTTTLANGEIRAYSSQGTGYDDGFLRISAGAGGNANTKAYIDVSGYSTVADMNENIAFGTNGAEKMRLNSTGLGIGTTSPGYTLDVSGSARVTALNGNNDGPVYADNNGQLVKSTACPSGFTKYDVGLTRLCILSNGTVDTWYNKELYCETQSGSSLCTYRQASKACNQGFSTSAGYWMSDAVGDDTELVTNGSGCNNFEGTDSKTNTHGAYCCMEYVRF